MLTLACAVLAGAAAAAPPAPSVAQDDRDVLAIGARYSPDPDAARRQRDLEEMQRLGFTVVDIVSREGGPAAAGLARLDRLLAGRTDERLIAVEVAVVSIAGTAGRVVRHEAWAAIAHGKSAVVFDDWDALRKNPDALVEAVEFAAHIMRNASLYGPLRPRQARPDGRDVTVDRNAPDVDARFLESSDVLLLVALNDAPDARTVTLSFSPEIPEAIWQDMLGGGAVHFVAGPAGPTYTRTLAPHDVLVLMIRTKWR